MNSSRQQDLRELIDHQSDGPVLSVFCRTDPREPSNKGESPGWKIALRNGLKAVVEATGQDRESHELARQLADEAQRRLDAMSASDRGRSVALFLGANGALDRMITFQIPFRKDHVAFDSGPVVWPMVDVIDRGLRTGLVLLSHDHIRLLEWRDGHARDLEESTWDLELGDWREYRGTVRPNPQRGRQSISNLSAYDQRVEEWRTRFFKAAAKAVAESARDLEFERLVVAAERDWGSQFTDSLPAETRSLVEASVPLNLIELSAAEAAGRLDPYLRQGWRGGVNAIAEQAVARVQGGERASAGADETLLALVEGRVAHLVLDPYLDIPADNLSDGAAQAIRDAGEASVSEALVELAVRTDARVSSASLEEVPLLEQGDGVLALLRY